MKATPLVLLFLAIFCVYNTHCWGSDGHKMIAQIAQHFLTPEANANMQKQLGNLTLPDIATLPDYYDSNPDGSWSSHLHYVDLPSNATQFEIQYCIETNGCVITAIYNYTYLLQKNKNIVNQCSNNATGTGMSEPCPLSFLTHFVGDSHQPLHVAFTVDRGGNSFAVEWFGQATNLHHVWDSEIIYEYEDYYIHGSWPEFGEELIQNLEDHPTLMYEYGNVTNPSTWGNESFELARYNAYNMEPGTVILANDPIKVDDRLINRRNFVPYSEAYTCACPNLSTPFYDKNILIVKRRLEAAGVRLANMLNIIYSTNFFESDNYFESLYNELFSFQKDVESYPHPFRIVEPRCDHKH
eukprot:TRINITY_DN560_c0_g1_i1.p1 TRINITY_DN560_c0_g1~~TRINITY_DN560_c0_g1_i1.p1  ORF type:complete len:354 (-),score=116.41 TRINITY_DN560_c0_g1_i1:224-1285(-)